MADIKFYYNGVEDATITASGGGSTSNLKDRNPSHKWTSASYATQTLTIDFGSARTCDTCVVDGINWADIVDGTVTIVLKYSSDGSSYSNAGTFTNSNTKQAISFTSAGARYWQISFTTSSPPTFLAYPTVGNIILGEVLTMTNVPYNASSSFGKQFATSKVRTIDGTFYSSQIFGGTNKWFIQFSNFSDTIRTNLLNLFSTIRGNLYPFYFSDFDATLNLVVLNNDLNTIDKKAYGVNDTIEMELETTEII